MAGSEVAKKSEGGDGKGIPIRIRNKTIFLKKVTISLTDLYGTESSSDEEEIYFQIPCMERKQKPRRFERSAYFISWIASSTSASLCGTRTTLSEYPGACLRGHGKWASQAYLGRKYEIYKKKVSQARMNANRQRSISMSSENQERTREG